ncbi:MAG TPA: TRAM domain-containing protein [Candidatus Saccharimonadales bacterium]|nr:TRAM domain-containing protein [Candidatus Saccharimonadales bacterium]
MELSTLTVGLTAINTVGLGYLVWQANHTSGKLKNQMVIDTSGLIDGRLVDIVQSGFVPQRIIVPQFVVAELQLLADQGDSFKRERARYGLEVVRRLQDMRQTDVVIRPGMARGIKEVDDKLVALAKKLGAMLYTTDFNLNQVAQIEGVRVLNVNELAQGLRAMHLPGEKTEIKITNVGQDRTQGVGYLEDGTMVVVEKAGNLVGQKVYVEFSRMLQTQAGKMMFAVMPRAHAAPVTHAKPTTPAESHKEERATSVAKPRPPRRRNNRRPVEERSV